MTLANSPEQLGLEIPEYASLPAHLPFGLYTRIDQILFVSGHIPDTAGHPHLRGRLGADLSVDEGRAAARLVALNLLSTLRHAAGDLDQIRGILKLTAFVASADGFTQQPDVVNAASEIFVELWGQKGLHARSAVGVAQLPLGAPVEIELIAEFEPGA